MAESTTATEGNSHCDTSVLSTVFPEFNYQNLPKASIDNIYDQFITLILSVSSPTKDRNSKPWFDKDCFHAHKQLKKLFSCSHLNDTSKAAFANCKKQYKQLIRTKKLAYEEKRQNTIIDKAETDKRCFWSILKVKPQKPAECYVTHSQWENHFRILFDTIDPICSSTDDISLLMNNQHDYLNPRISYEPRIDERISLTEITKALIYCPQW